MSSGGKFLPVKQEIKGMKIAYFVEKRSDNMQVQTITNLKSNASVATESFKAQEAANTFAKLMSEAMQSNTDYNIDYAKVGRKETPYQDNAATAVIQSPQEAEQLDVKGWLDSQSHLEQALSKPQETKSSAIEKPPQFNSIPYIDANGQPTNDIKLAIQAANNQLDSKVNELLGFSNDDFELGGKLYGKQKSAEIVTWYNNSDNKVKLGELVKQTAVKFGLPSDTQNLMPSAMIKPVVDNQMALAGRASATPDYTKFPDTVAGRAAALETWQTSSRYFVDPMEFTHIDDFANAQSSANLNKLTDEIKCYKEYGVDVLTPESGGLPSSHALSLARLQAQQGLGVGDNLQAKANWFGITIENYEKAIRGEKNAVKLESPIQRLASEVARAGSVLKPEVLIKQYPKVFGENGLLKKYPDIFQSSSNEFKNMMQKTYPGSLEYESSLKNSLA
jgi:hypothetical protein